MLPLSISDSSLSFALVFLHPPRCPSLSPPPPPPPPLSGDSSHPARHSHPNQRPLWSRSEHKSRGIRSSPQTAMPSSTTKGSRSPLPLPRSPPSSPLSSSLLRGPVPLVRSREQQRSARAADIGEEEESERAFVFLARHGLLPPFSQPFLSPTISLSNHSPAPNFLPPIHPHPSSLSLFLSLSLSLSSPAALGLESISIPALDKAVASTSAAASSSSSAPLSRQAAKLADADAAFESSELLRTLKERTAANSEANRKAITDKYCLRQSELGVGDCAGLRLIPGATKSGKQKTPKLLAKLIGKEEAIEAYNNNESNEAAIAAVEKMRKNVAP